MVDALVLGTSVLRREGSTPSSGTMIQLEVGQTWSCSPRTGGEPWAIYTVVEVIDEVARVRGVFSSSSSEEFETSFSVNPPQKEWVWELLSQPVRFELAL